MGERMTDKKTGIFTLEFVANDEALVLVCADEIVAQRKRMANITIGEQIMQAIEDGRRYSVIVGPWREGYRDDLIPFRRYRRSVVISLQDAAQAEIGEYVDVTLERDYSFDMAGYDKLPPYSRQFDGEKYDIGLGEQVRVARRIS